MENIDIDDDKILVSKKELSYINSLVKSISNGTSPDFNENIRFENLYLQEIYDNVYKQHSYIKELNSYSLDISRGNLDVDFPPRRNYLASGLKELHANLMHLVWKVKKIAKGDYEQSIDFLGQLSEAFNHMLNSLLERETQILELKRIIEIIRLYSNIMIYVIDIETLDILYCKRNEDYSTFDDFLKFKVQQLFDKDNLDKYENTLKKWEVYFPEKSKWYNIDSLFITWTNNEKAFFHILIDISNQKNKINNLERKIETDQMTGAFNYTFALNKLNELITTEQNFSVCFMDLDGLKTANDKYGHNIGDGFIIGFVEIINASKNRNDMLCRMGGDEFLLISQCVNIIELELTLKTIHDNIALFNSKEILPIPIAFSFGYIEFNKNIHFKPTDILNQADQKMYKNKKSKYNSTTSRI